MTSFRPDLFALAFSLALLPHGLEAQFGSGPGRAAPAGWAPAAVGVRVGFDNAQSEPTVGALVRIPVLPNGSVELVPNVDVTFLPGFKAYQFNFEAVYLTEGRAGGFYLGGGPGFRNSVFGPDPSAPRRNERTFSLVVGVRLGGLDRFRPELETRWILQDEQARDPRLVAVGVSMALW